MKPKRVAQGAAGIEPARRRLLSLQPLMQPTLLRAWLMAWLMAVLLLLAQAAGLTHRTVHAPGLARGAAAPLGVVKAQAVTAATAGAVTAFAGLREHAPFGAECRLLDALAHADSLFGAPPACMAVESSGASSGAPATAAAPRFAGAPYQARAPPLG